MANVQKELVRGENPATPQAQLTRPIFENKQREKLTEEKHVARQSGKHAGRAKQLKCDISLVFERLDERFEDCVRVLGDGGPL